jgi:hypothetical protein
MCADTHRKYDLVHQHEASIINTLHLGQYNQRLGALTNSTHKVSDRLAKTPGNPTETEDVVGSMRAT